MTRPLLAAAALAALGFTGALLLLPGPLRRAALAVVEQVTDDIVTAAADAWHEDIA